MSADVRQSNAAPASIAGVSVPWERAVHPYGAVHLERAEAAAARAGLLSSEKDVARFRAFAEIDLHFFHYAALERLTAAASYSEWMYFLDDSYDDDPAFASDLAAVRQRMERCFEILRTGVLPSEPTALERFSRHVHRSLTAFGGPTWHELFLRRTRAYLFEGSLRSMASWVDGGPKSVEEYSQIRFHDSGVWPVLACSMIASGRELSAHVLEHPAIQALERTAVLHVGFLNDIFSYHKEVVRHGYPCNLVHVIAVEQGVDLPGAVAIAVDRVNALAHSLEEQVRELPTFGAEDAAVAQYVVAMKALMRGNYDFSRRSRRFRDPQSPFTELRRSRTLSLEMAAVVLPAAGP